MASTANGFPYPINSDPVNVPGDIQALANAINTSPCFSGPLETVSVVASAATGVLNFDAITSGVAFYTVNATGNVTLNLRGNSTTSLNTLMVVGESLTVGFLITNGATPYYVSAFQVDGSSVTPKWSGGAAPSSGNASSVDAYTFTVIKTATTPTYTVLASGPIKYA